MQFLGTNFMSNMWHLSYQHTEKSQEPPSSCHIRHHSIVEGFQLLSHFHWVSSFSVTPSSSVLEEASESVFDWSIVRRGGTVKVLLRTEWVVWFMVSFPVPIKNSLEDPFPGYGSRTHGVYTWNICLKSDRVIGSTCWSGCCDWGWCRFVFSKSELAVQYLVTFLVGWI